jgi:nucleosome binding factor SPN SPT16 subunit
MMVGKKKTDDIQFYSEGGIVAEDVVGRGRG